MSEESRGQSGPRHLHLALPNSPGAEETKVTDMSLGSDGSSNKTPGFEAFRPKESGEGGEGRALKRSVSSTLDEEEDEEGGGLGSRSRSHLNNNNTEYADQSSDDNLLESLDRKVCLLWEGKQVMGRERSTPVHSTCSSVYRCGLCRSPPTARPSDRLSEEEEGEGEEVKELPSSAGDKYQLRDRTESNETLDSVENETSSREDLYGDKFGVFSDEEQTAGRHDSNYYVIQRRW
jgi:hypothetical protein